MVYTLRLLAILTLFLSGYISPTNFSVTTNVDSGPGSLRQAIIDSNGNNSDPLNTITFDPGLTITLLTNLDPITYPVIINNTSVAVTIDGNNVAKIGFEISGAPSSGTTIQNITLLNFQGAVGDDSDGILVNASNGNVISNNNISIITAGSGGNGYGIFINGNDNAVTSTIISAIVGGTSNNAGGALGIIITGNNNSITTTTIAAITGGSGTTLGGSALGISIQGNNNTVTSNTSGINGGSGPTGGDAFGISVSGTNNIITSTLSAITGGAGGTLGIGGVGGNAYGISLDTAANTLVQNNGITTIMGGSAGLGGTPGIATGIWIQNNSVNNLIGGLNDNTSLGNTISGLTQTNARGIVVADATSFNNTIESNSIFNIAAKGIDLQGLGNNNQVAPIITSIVRCSGGPLAITGTLANTGNGTPYRIQFFNNGAVSAANEGKTLIGSITFTGTGVPVENFSGNFTPLVPVAVNDWISATASVEPGMPNVFGDSSEFSVEFQATTSTLSVSAGQDQAGCAPVNFQLTAIANGGIQPYTYLWAPAAGLSNPAIFNPDATPTQTTMYTVTVTDSMGCTASDSVTITVNQTPVITEQPDNQVICDGALASFTATASGMPVPTVQWQVSTNGGVSFSDIGGETNTTYSFNVNQADNNNQYRAVFTTNGCSTTTSAATLTVNPVPVITEQPDNQVICDGALASFTATASGMPVPTVQWQVSTNGGVSFSDIGGETNTTYSFNVNQADNNNQYRAVFTTNGCSSTTAAATLTVNQAPAITQQPANQVVCDGAVASFTATASGMPVPTVQWQVSTNGGVSFSDIGGETNTTYSFNASQADNNNQYRAVFTNTCGIATTDAATLTVNQTPVIIEQPDNQVVCLGATAIFTAAASGIPTPTVQWQESANGGVTFTNIGGATNTTLSFTPVLSDSGNQYQAVFTNSCGVAPTTAATLTVNPLPTISTSANPGIITRGQSSTLTATLGSGTPPYFVTFSDGFISPVSVNTSVTHAVSPTTTTTYSAIVTDALNCESDPSNTITLTVINPTPPPSDLKVIICGPKCRVTKSRKPRISGRTTPGAIVRLYANNTLVAKTKANTKGVFVVKPCCMLKRGCNTLVAQAVNNSGNTAHSNRVKINVTC